MQRKQQSFRQDNDKFVTNILGFLVLLCTVCNPILYSDHAWLISEMDFLNFSPRCVDRGAHWLELRFRPSMQSCSPLCYAIKMIQCYWSFMYQILETVT
jgi:hypothetical protein